MSSFLPYARQFVDDDDVAAVARVLKGDWLTTGPAVEEFERALAARVGAAEAVAVSSGTAALHLACLALGLGPGDRAVVPAVTFVATANAARFVGAEVVFADVDPETGLMGPGELAGALAAGPARAVLPVHLGGQAADMAGIAGVAGRHGLAVVEDACHALGTVTDGPDGAAAVGACRFSRMACFSFHPVKTVAMGEGGAVTTNEPGLAEVLRRARSHGLVRAPAALSDRARAVAEDGRPNPWYYEMPEVGFNYRASDIHCALGLSQLGKLDAFLARRRALVARYDARLAPLAPLVRPAARVAGCRPGWHLYAVLIDFPAAGLGRARLMEELRKRGIGSQVHYLPVHHQPYYRRRYGETRLPGADAYYARCLSLPLSAAMTEADVDRVADALGGILAGKAP